jgi:hypothetical protein
MSREPAVLPRGARPWVVAWSGLSAFALAWAALVLPWRPGAPLGLLLWALGILHLCTAITAAWRPERVGSPLRLLSLGSLAVALISSVSIGVTAVEMVQLFGQLGWALTVALCAIGWLLLLATVPVALAGRYFFGATSRNSHDRT